MNEYKVIFENNIPVFARRCGNGGNGELLKITNEGNRKFINWMVVYGDSEFEAIDIADKVIKTIWSEYLA